MPRSMITRLSIQALFIGLLTTQAVQAQKDASAILQLDSTTQGMLPPRMTTTQRDAIATPAKGLMIFNTSTDKIDFFDGTSWVVITASTDAVPTGTVDAFAGSTAPTGYLLCDGSVISRTTYADLFSVIGTTYGAGDGSTTFKLPDLRGEFIRGLNTGNSSKPDNGRTLGSIQKATSIPATYFRLNDGYFGYGTSLNSSYFSTPDAYEQDPQDVALTGAKAERLDFSTIGVQGGNRVVHRLNGGNNLGHRVRPRNIAMNYIIKY